MSEAEKRSLTTDALATLGLIITDKEKRDAIHIAVEPCLAAHGLRPGEHVGRVEGGAYGICDNPVGIVDPFLKRAVLKGERFWLLIYPRQITSLRHVWSHPAFGEPSELAATLGEGQKEASERWLRNFIAGADCPSYETVMRIIQGEDTVGGYISGEYLHFSGRDAHGDIPPEFWVHAEVVTGRKFEERPEYFSCSC